MGGRDIELTTISLNHYNHENGYHSLSPCFCSSFNFYPSPLERPETAKKYKDLLKIHQYADSRRVEWEEGGIATYQWMAVDQCVVAKFCGAAENFDRLNTVVGTYLPRWID